MKALILITVFFHLFLAGNAQTKDNALFDKAENLFKQAHIEGDYTGWQKADSIFSELQQRKGFASVEKKLLAGLYQISIAVRSNADPAQSLKLVDNYIETYYAENLKNSYIIQKLLFWREHLRLRLDKPDAIQNLKNQISWHLDQENLNFEILANLNDVLARYYYGQREIKKSINYGKKAIKNYKNTSLNDLYISSLQFTGGLYYNIDKIDSCLYYMQDAYKLMKAAKSPNNLRLSQLAFNLGMIYQGKTGEFIEAEHHLKEAVEFEIKANGEESPTLITYYSLLADNFYFIKDLEQAAYYALKGYLLANDIVKTESVYLRSLPSMSFSRIYARKGDFGKARQVIDRVVEESIDFFGHNHTFTTQVFIDKAYVEHLAGDFDEAEKYFLAAVSAGEETGRLYSKLSAYASLTAMYLENEDYEKALYYSKKALLLKEREQSTGYTLNAVLYLYKVKSYLGLGDLEA